jgi:hypothetical protein
MDTNIAANLIHAPTINVTMNGGDQDAANQIVTGVSKALNDARPDSFRKSTSQMAGETSFHLQRHGLGNGWPGQVARFCSATR